MIKKLPVFLKLNQNVYQEVELKKPSGALLSDTEEARQKNEFLAMRNFVAGCIEAIRGDNGQDVVEITDSVSIKSAVAKMSNKSVEYLSQEIMIDYYDGDDYVEGIYPCPMCNSPCRAEKTDIDGMIIDTRDRISELPVYFMQDESELFFDIEFVAPIKIDSAQTEDEIKNITMTFPSLEHYIEVLNSMSTNNKVKFQYAIYAKAIVKANGQDVDNSWRKSKGIQLFNRSQHIKKDIGKISEYINKYGVIPKLEKECNKCGKVWQPIINTSNFFGSGLL